VFSQVQHELGQLIPFLGAAVVRYPRFKKDDQHFSALNQELQHCRDVFNELQNLQQNYENLPSQSRIAWERTGRGIGLLAQIQKKIASSRQNFTMLNTEMIR
jgi:hypothetical protein